MKKERFTLGVSQQGTIVGYKWYNPSCYFFKGVVILVHGMAEHIERYDEFAQTLAKEGYIVYGHNQRGHKDSIKSDNDYGYMSDNDNFSILVTDLKEIYDYIQKEYLTLPIYMFGHSMGSFVVQRFAQLYGSRIQGIILSGSAKNPKLSLFMGMLLAGIIKRCKGPKSRSKLLYNLIFGSFNKRYKPNRTKYDWLNSVPDEVDKYCADKYCGGIFTSVFYRDFFRGLYELNLNYDLIPKELPIFIISGKADPVGGSSKLVKRLYRKYNRLGITNLKFKLYPQARHEIIHEVCKGEVYADCLNWLDRIRENNPRTKKINL